MLNLMSSRYSKLARPYPLSLLEKKKMDMFYYLKGHLLLSSHATSSTLNMQTL